MSYTLWSRGRLLGLTDLGFIYRKDGFRCGWLHPNELGDRLMPAATAVAAAMRAMHTMPQSGLDPTAEADVVAATDRQEALELELRGPNGIVIATESIGIIDTHYLLSLAERELSDDEAVDLLDAEEQAEIDATVAEWLDDLGPEEPWRQPEEFPQYQIQVRLVDHDAVP